MSTIRNRQLHNRHPELPDFRILPHGHTSPADGGVIGLDVSGGVASGGSSGGGTGSAVSVTDGTTIVGGVSSIDFTSGATVSALGGGVAGVAVAAPSPASTVTGPDAFGASAVVGTSAAYARADHDHGLPSAPTTHYLVIASSHSTPLVFNDLVQTSAGDDLVYTT